LSIQRKKPHELGQGDGVDMEKKGKIERVDRGFAEPRWRPKRGARARHRLRRVPHALCSEW
jgi:hypothetical protein